MAIASFLRRFDRVLYGHPFEGALARRYEVMARPAFGDLDDRLLDALAPLLGNARQLLDVGAGPGTFATRAARRHPELSVIGIDPSRDFARLRPGVAMARAAGEAIPLGTGSIDVAMCLSSIRHVRDPEKVLSELRRVIVAGGRLVIVELDPAAATARVAHHAARLGTRLLRRGFARFVLRTAPPVAEIEALAVRAGFTRVTLRDDAVQPVYILELA